MFGRCVTQQNHDKKKKHYAHPYWLRESVHKDVESKVEPRLKHLIETIQLPVARKPKALAASEVVSCLG